MKTINSITKKFLCAIAICLVSCSSKSDQSNNQIQISSLPLSDDSVKTIRDNLFEIDSTSDKEFDNAKKEYKNYFVPGNSTKVKIEGENLIIQSDQKQIFFNNSKSVKKDDENVYKYLGELKPLNYFVVLSANSEYSECLLVNEQNGTLDTTWTLPFVSPDSNYITCQSLPYGMEGVPNGLQVYKVINNSLKKYFEIDQQDWIPVDLVWKSNNTIIIKAMKMSDFLKEVENKFIYLSLSIKA